MTFNELKAGFDNDDLNPNAELIFHVNMDAHTDEHVIDDIAAEDNHIAIYLRGR